jgi:molybdopterin-dependent oxidoreductase alpha subunit
MKKVKSGGGWPAVRYAWRRAREAGGLLRFTKALSTKNTCKTCALGMGGQRGGMVDEAGHRFEVCKKSMQAMAADMQDRVPLDFFASRTFAGLARLTPNELEHAGRLVEPYYAGPNDDTYRAISWSDALTKVVDKLKTTAPDETFFYASGRSSNEAAFLLSLFTRIFGTNNVNNCSYYCHQASGVGLTSSVGTGTATVVLDDLYASDLVFLIGGNPASNHPRLVKILADIRKRGGDVIVINPVVETGLVKFAVPSRVGSLLFGSSVASEYVQPHIGGDIALLTGIAKVVDARGTVNQTFIDNHTENWTAFRDHIRSVPWSTIHASSGVSRDVIERLANRYARADNVVFSWAMGITHHAHGSDNVRAIANLALMRGMVGKRHAGLMPIRGHSNVQGVGSVGFTPKLKAAVLQRVEEHFKARLPTTEGLDTMACMEASAEGRMRFALCLGGNLYASNPDSAFAAKAMSRLDMVVYLSTTLNQGHVIGRGRESLILPVLARDEEPQPTTQESMFNYVRLSDGGPRRHDGPRSEVSVLANIARRVLDHGGPIDFKAMEQHHTIRSAIAAVIPGYEKIGEIDSTREEFQIDGRTLHAPTFPTPTGRAMFHVTPVPATQVNGDENRFHLMTVRSEGQFNTVVYEEEDLYRGQERRDVILLNRDDIRRLGLSIDDRVTVRGDAGALHDILVREFAIKAGNALMYYPEANVLLSRHVDPESRTPAFKGATVTIEK